MEIMRVAVVLVALLAGVLSGCGQVEKGLTGDPRMDCEIKAARKDCLAVACENRAYQACLEREGLR